jgi:hypothetical protein
MVDKYSNAKSVAEEMMTRWQQVVTGNSGEVALRTQNGHI